MTVFERAYATKPNIFKGDAEMNEYESYEDSDASRLCSIDGYSEDEDFSLDSRAASQDQYCGRLAAEKWLLRVYLRRCCRFLLSWFPPAKPGHSTSDDNLPF